MKRETTIHNKWIKLLSLLTIIILFNQCKIVERNAINRKNEAIYRGLNTTNKLVSSENFPKATEISLFLEKGIIEASLKGLEGTILTNKKEGEYNGWYCKVNTLEFKPVIGAFNTNLMLTIFNDKDKKKGEIELENLLIATYGERDDDKEQLNIRLDLLPIAYHLNAKVWGVNIGTRKKNKFLADLFNMLAGSNLHTNIAIRDKIESNFQLKKNTADTMFYDNDEKEMGYVILKTKTEMHNIVNYLQFEAPAFLPNGLWINFSLAKQPLNIVDSQIEKVKIKKRNLDAVNDSLKNVIENKLTNENAVIWINKSMFTKTFTEINELPPSIRTVYVNSIEEKGHLAKEDWVNYLGKGGYYAELTHKEAIRGTLVLKKIETRWEPKKGLSFDIDLKVKIKADVHVHFDPYIGGGFGGQINAVGTSNENLRGSVEFVKESIGDIEALLIKTNIECKNAKVTIASDNEEFGSIGKLATIGIRTEQTIGDEYIEPTAFFSDIPLYYKFTEDRSKKDIYVDYPYKYMMTKFSIDNIQIDNEGVLININDSVIFTSNIGDIDKINFDNEKLNEGLKNYYSKQKKSCPELEPIVAFVGPFEFGPNNDVLKALAKLGADMEKLAGSIEKEWYKYLKDPDKSIADMPENVQKASEKAVKDFAAEAKRAQKILEKANKELAIKAAKLHKSTGRKLTKAKKKVDDGLTKAWKKVRSWRL